MIQWSAIYKAWFDKYTVGFRELLVCGSFEEVLMKFWRTAAHIRCLSDEGLTYVICSDGKGFTFKNFNVLCWNHET